MSLDGYCYVVWWLLLCSLVLAVALPVGRSSAGWGWKSPGIAAETADVYPAFPGIFPRHLWESGLALADDGLTLD